MVKQPEKLLIRVILIYFPAVLCRDVVFDKSLNLISSKHIKTVGRHVKADAANTHLPGVGVFNKVLKFFKTKYRII